MFIYDSCLSVFHGKLTNQWLGNDTEPAFMGGNKCNRLRFLLDVGEATFFVARSSKFRALIIRNEPFSREALGFIFIGNFWPNDLTVASISKLFSSCLMTCIDSATFGKYSGHFQTSYYVNTSIRGALIIHLPWRVIINFNFSEWVTWRITDDEYDKFYQPLLRGLQEHPVESNTNSRNLLKWKGKV